MKSLLIGLLPVAICVVGFILLVRVNSHIAIGVLLVGYGERLAMTLKEKELK